MEHMETHMGNMKNIWKLTEMSIHISLTFVSGETYIFIYGKLSPNRSVYRR
jgi:hypothetical protein